MPNPNKYLLQADTGTASPEHKKKMEELQRQAHRAGVAGSNAYAQSHSSSGSSSSGGYDGGYDDDDSGYSGGGSESSFDWAAYYAELQRQAQERANAAYERNMQRIASAYDSAAGSLSSNYDSTVGRLDDARNKSMGDVNSDAEKSLQEAYINNMLSKKNLNQRLSAMGYNGGATETTMAQLANNYGNSRTGINETLNKNISDLNATYADNLAAALQSYNSAKANLDLQRMQLEMQAENQRNNAIDSSMSANMSIDSGYASALQAALANQTQYTYDPTMATNDFVAGQAQQAQGAAQGNNYAMWIAQQLLSGGNNNVTDVSRYLMSKGYNQETIYDILKKLGAA